MTWVRGEGVSKRNGVMEEGVGVGMGKVEK